MHSRVVLLVHVVWSTKLRQRVLTPAADGWLADVVARKAVQAGCRVLACGNDWDHVHVLARCPSTVTLASVVQLFKGSSSYEWNTTGAPGRLSWQEGYWAESVSPEAIVGDATAAGALLADAFEQPPKPEPTKLRGDRERMEVYGDASYGTADLVERLEAAGIEPNVKVQAASPPRAGMLSQDDFVIDTLAGTACCPRGVVVHLRMHQDGSRSENFARACTDCPLRSRCTSSRSGRTLSVHPKHETLVRSRKTQRADAWRRRYRATRPKVERKIAHLVRRKHGGRRARVRGRLRVSADFALLAAAVNLARLAVLAA